MTRETMGFGPFIARLERRLDELPPGQLRRVLLEHGARLPGGERVGFLHLVRPPLPQLGMTIQTCDPSDAARPRNGCTRTGCPVIRCAPWWRT